MAGDKSLPFSSKPNAISKRNWRNCTKSALPPPVEPPVRNKFNNRYLSRLKEPYCRCQYHLYEPEMGRYKKLIKKEEFIFGEIKRLNQDMAELSSYILEHPCHDDDFKMKKFYHIHCSSDDGELEYRKLQAAVDADVGVPIKLETFGLKPAFKDPIKFRVAKPPKPFVNTCTPLTFERTPSAISNWFVPLTGESEYHDNYDKSGLLLLRSIDQYKEPQPSSRRRADDRCL